MGPGKRRSSREPWGVKFFIRHQEDDPATSCPGEEFLDGCPAGVRTTLIAILHAVAVAPPPSFSGGGMWEAMHGEMSGYYEVRARSENRLYRLFCILERTAPGLADPTVVVITGMVKPIDTVFTPAEYARVKALGDEYRRRSPRSVA